jgi:hypothetical protein
LFLVFFFFCSCFWRGSKSPRMLFETNHHHGTKTANSRIVCSKSERKNNLAKNVILRVPCCCVHTCKILAVVQIVTAPTSERTSVKLPRHFPRSSHIQIVVKLIVFRSLPVRERAGTGKVLTCGVALFLIT